MNFFLKQTLLLVSFFLMNTSFSQDSLETKKFFNPELIEVGAGLGLDAFGSSGVVLSLQPSLILPFTERIHFGIKPNLTYFRDLVSNSDDIIFGASILGRGYFSENFYGQLEFEELNANAPGISTTNPRQWIPSLMIGGGYRKKIDIVSTYVTGMYIVNYRSTNSVYPRPIVIRAGVTFLLSELMRK